MAYENLKYAVKCIADDCDGAFEKDKMGFNKPDASRMHQLAYMQKWTRSEALDAFQRLYKYQNKQLPAHGINWEDIPHPNTDGFDFPWDKKNLEDEITDYSKMACDQVEVLLEGNEKACAPPIFIKRFFVDKDIRMKFTLEKDERGIWWVARAPEPEPEADPISSIEELRALDWTYIRESKKPTFKAALYTHNMVPGFWNLWKAFKPELKEEGFGCARDQYSGEWHIKWWKQTVEEIPEVVPEPEVKEFDFSDTILYDWQQAHAANLARSLDKYKISIDKSGTGAGKTPINLSVFKKLGLKPFVICPKPVIPGWFRNAEMVVIDLLGVVNYESAKLGKQTIKKPYKRKKGYKLANIKSEYITVSANPNPKNKWDTKYIYTFNFPENAVLVFDEVHRCKNIDTQNTQLLLQAAQQGIRIAGLSATLASSPLKMFAVGTALKLFDTEHYWGFWNWVKMYGCSKEIVKYNRNGEPVYAWQYDRDPIHMQNINIQIGDRMSGIDLGALIKMGKFPTSQIIAEAYNLNGNTSKLDSIYNQLIDLAAEYEKEADYFDQQEDAHLSKRQKLHQQVELLKVPAIVDLVKDAILEEKSVAIFVNFTETLHQLGHILKTRCFIYGRNSGQINEMNRLAFENNESPIIICNIAAAREGIDLHDKYDKRERLSIIIPSDNAQYVKQALGRVHRAGGTHSQQILFYAANTIEEEICNNLKGKLENINALNDTDLMVKF
jgi:superfamily II DNA or RNA helicase